MVWLLQSSDQNLGDFEPTYQTDIKMRNDEIPFGIFPVSQQTKHLTKTLYFDVAFSFSLVHISKLQLLRKINGNKMIATESTEITFFKLAKHLLTLYDASRTLYEKAS